MIPTTMGITIVPTVVFVTGGDEDEEDEDEENEDEEDEEEEDEDEDGEDEDDEGLVEVEDTKAGWVTWVAVEEVLGIAL